MPKPELFTPKQGIPGGIYVAVGLVSAATGILVWCVLSYGGLVESYFLPTPTQVARAFVEMAGDGSLWRHVWASTSVVLTGFVLAGCIAVPLGILMGSFSIVAAAVEPVTNFIRYLPVSALVPLLILWVGIGLEQKVAVIFLGVVFNLTIMVADVSAGVSKALLEVGYTLGATRRQVVWKILAPATLPGVMDALRVNMGVAWTYVVVAELVAASEGLGFMILNAMRGLFTEVIFLGIVVIGLLGLITDQGLKWLRRGLLPWAS